MGCGICLTYLYIFLVICCWNKNALCDTPQWCVCFLACLPSWILFLSPFPSSHCIYLQQINLLLSTDQTRKRKLTCEMNTNIVSSYDLELSFVLTYIHNLYARAYYMFEVYLDFAHLCALKFLSCANLASVWFSTNVDVQTFARRRRRRERKKSV